MATLEAAATLIMASADEDVASPETSSSPTQTQLLLVHSLVIKSLETLVNTKIMAQKQGHIEDINVRKP
jgi:hypothetical protein